MSTVFANGRSILHAGDGLQHIAAPPDVCKTPSPGGPIPVPYVNIAADSDLAKGSKSVLLAGKSAALESSNLGTSTGDEPGTAGGGVVSSKTKGKLTWSTASPDVKFEGKCVVRFMDVTQHNGNSFNSAFISRGGTGLAYADDFTSPCQICSQGPERHRVMETGNVAEKAVALTKRLREMFSAATTDAERCRVARTRDDGATWSGYMVGVMACKCPKPQYFCTNSGDTLPGLVEAARDVGGLSVVPGGRATQDEFIRANQSGRHPQQVRTSVANAFRRVNESRNELRRAGYNVPGTCAGAKLVARCKHAPLYMSETFFSPPGTSWTGRYKVWTTSASAAAATGRRLANYPDWVARVLANRQAKRLKQDYATGESVASCHSCQELLFLTNCPERTCPG